MKFEDLLQEINGFGRFQKMILCLTFLGRFTLPCHFLINNFIAGIPSHHCDINWLDGDGDFGDWDLLKNLSMEQRLTVSIPKQADGSFSSCLMYTEPQLHLLQLQQQTGNLFDNNITATQLPTVPCQNGWVYDNSTFTSTLASEWDLVCERKGMNKGTATIFFIGVMFGAVFFGSMSDRKFGRCIMLLVSYVSGMAFALGSIFSTSYVMFAVLRFFTGFSIIGIVIATSVLIVEWVDIKSRRLVGVIDALSWTCGYMLLSFLAFFIRDWKWLIVAATSPVAFSIISWRWVPESARWLIANGRLDEAHHYLKKCIKMNGKQEKASSIKPENLSNIVMSDRGGRKYSYLDLLRTPKMRKLALFTGLTWYGVGSTFYGISYNIAGFGVNIYLTQFIYTTVEVPARLSIYYLIDKIGRRKTQCGSLFLAGLSLAMVAAIPKDHKLVMTVIAVLGKGFSATSFATLGLYSNELYPTVVRQNGMGWNNLCGRMGVALAPLILLLDDVGHGLPQVVLCLIAMATSLVASRLPETRGRCLPEAIEDVEGTRAPHVESPVLTEETEKLGDGNS
ncbi:solute carrier family 22 member 7-like [Engraulis encrasicolus]|uniref:solute carrier family 22 member 7-like n=1 Tax=Engraulis encrasicolus TaxID=184585 RepID=UPI002FD77194